MQWIDILFPGVIVHELAHAFACVLGGVPVHQIEMRGHSGKVVHGWSSSRNAWMIGFAPLVVGVFLSFLFFVWAQEVLSLNPGLGIVLIWLGFSIGFHAIPSHQDILNIPAAVRRQFQLLWESERSLLIKLGKTGVYAIVWPISLLFVGVAWVLNVSILFRALLGLGLFWLAGSGPFL